MNVELCSDSDSDSCGIRGATHLFQANLSTSCYYKLKQVVRILITFSHIITVCTAEIIQKLYIRKKSSNRFFYVWCGHRFRGYGLGVGNIFFKWQNSQYIIWYLHRIPDAFPCKLHTTLHQDVKINLLVIPYHTDCTSFICTRLCIPWPLN